MSSQPWELPRASLVPFAQTLPVSQLHDQDAGPRTYSEEDLHAYTLQCRLRETTPPFVPSFAVGTWSMDTFDGLWQLRRYPIRALLFPGGDPYASNWGWFSDMQPWLIDKYVGWLHEGHEPPPLRAYETEKGHIKVTNGHNRAASLVRVGRHETLVWVALAYFKSHGVCTDLTHSLAVEAALREGKPVPADVLGDYPQFAELHAGQAA